MKILKILLKASLIFLKHMIIIPLVICDIPFILIGIAGIDQVCKCMVGKATK